MNDDIAIKTELTESGYSTVQNSCIETSTDSEDEFDFDITAPDDLSKYRIWYDKLLSMREQYLRKERGAFPPFPPPPLRSTMIAASQAFYVNPFEEIKNAKVENVEQLFRERNDQLYSHRFHPSDFRPLPPPHVFLRIIQTLAPHEYVDLTYALAGAILLEVEVRIPMEFPPLPPRMEPFSKWLDEEEHSDVSSQSSSDGEYSDDSECTKMEKEERKKMNKKRREERRHRILNNQKQAEANCEENVDSNPEQIVHNLNYKQRTINEFIPQKPSPPLYPFMNPFFNYPFFAGYPYWILGMPIIFYPPRFPSNFFYQNQNISSEDHEKPDNLTTTPSPKPDIVELEENQTTQIIDEITVQKAKPEEIGRKKKFNKKSNHHHHHKNNKTEQYKRNPNYYNKLILKAIKKPEN